MSTRHDRAARKLTHPGRYPGVPARAFKRAWHLTPRNRRAGLLRRWEEVIAGKAKFSQLALAGYLRVGGRYDEATRVLEAAKLAAARSA